AFEQPCVVDDGIGTRDEQHELTTPLIGIGPHALSEVRKLVIKDGLEQLGQFAREHGVALAAEYANEIIERLGGAMTGFIEDQRARLATQRLELRAARGRLCRQEAFEYEAIRRQSCHR